MNNKFLQASVLSLLAAAGMGIIWVAVAYFAKREFSIIAVGVGIAAGRAFVYQMKKDEEYQEGNLSYGIAALITTAIVLVAVRYGIWHFLVNDPAYPFTTFLLDEVKAMDRDAFLTIFFYGIALYTAFTAATGKEEEENADSETANNESTSE